VALGKFRGKDKVTLRIIKYQAMITVWKCVTAQHILNLDTRWRCALNVMSCPLCHTGERAPEIDWMGS
jgi:hypothetical protein